MQDYILDPRVHECPMESRCMHMTLDFAVLDAKRLKQAIERSTTALNTSRPKSRRYPQRNVPRMQYYETDNDDAVEDDDVSFRKFAVYLLALI